MTIIQELAFNDFQEGINQLSAAAALDREHEIRTKLLADHTLTGDQQHALNHLLIQCLERQRALINEDGPPPTGREHVVQLAFDPGTDPDVARRFKESIVAADFNEAVIRAQAEQAQEQIEAAEEQYEADRNKEQELLASRKGVWISARANEILSQTDRHLTLEDALDAAEKESEQLSWGIG